MDKKNDSLHSICLRIVSRRGRSAFKTAILEEWFRMWPVQQHVYDRIQIQLEPTHALYRYHQALQTVIAKTRAHPQFKYPRRLSFSIAGLECRLIMRLVATKSRRLHVVTSQPFYSRLVRLATTHAQYMHPLLYNLVQTL
jgi:hypothetical protein